MHKLLLVLRSFLRFLAFLTGEYTTPLRQGQESSCPPAASPLPTLQTSRYALRQRLGQGGQGQIHLAQDRCTGGVVAVKTSQARADLLHEAGLLLQLAHPSIPCFIAAGAEEGQAWLALEYIQGVTLEQWRLQGGGRRPWREVCAVGQQIVEALAYLHGQGIAHLDLKPDNVLLPPGQPASIKLIDFGLALPFGASDPRRWGTPGYTAPERAQGAVTPEADIFGLGVVLHELLSGVTPPFSGFTWSPLPPEVPGQLQALLAGMTAPDPRYRPTAAQVGWALAHLLPLPAPPVPVLAPTHAALEGDPQATLPVR
jgi:serine/threonine protein kinase